MPDPVAAIFGLNPNNDDKTLPVWYNEWINKQYGSLGKNYNRKDVNAASDMFGGALNDYYPQSSANAAADWYGGKTREIINDPGSYIGDFERILGAKTNSLTGIFKNVADYNLARLKGSRVAGGYGNVGPSSHEVIANASLTGTNMAPVLSTLYGTLGQEATESNRSREDRNRYLVNLFQQDPLGGYANTAAARSIAPYLAKLGLTGGAVSGLSNLVGAPGIKGNLSGYENVKGLTSRLNDIGKDITSMATGGLYGQSYGSQPGQDTATTMGLIGTAASMYGGSNQYQPPPQAAPQPAFQPAGGGYNYLQGSYYPPQQSYAPAMQSMYPSTANSFGAPTNALNYNMNAYGLSPAYQANYQQFMAPALY